VFTQKKEREAAAKKISPDVPVDVAQELPPALPSLAS